MDVAITGLPWPGHHQGGISQAAFGMVMSRPIGLAIGALLVGPMSDRFGPKSC